MIIAVSQTAGKHLLLLAGGTDVMAGRGVTVQACVLTTHVHLLERNGIGDH